MFSPSNHRMYVSNWGRQIWIGEVGVIGEERERLEGSNRGEEVGQGGKVEGSMGGREQEAEGEEVGVDKPGECDVQIGTGPGKSESEVILDGVEQE